MTSSCCNAEIREDRWECTKCGENCYEESLSDKILPRSISKSEIHLDVADVKQFIRKESALLTELKLKQISWLEFQNRRLDLIGGKLI